MITVTAKKREKLGKGVRQLRRQGVLPAVLYGAGVKATPIEVPAKEFEKVWRGAGEHTLITLEVEGGEEQEGKKGYTVLIHDIGRDPIKDSIIHVDFYAVSMDKLVRTHVPILIDGESPAVKNFGGVLVQSIRGVEVESLPKDLPHELKLDISGLAELNMHRAIKDIPVPETAKILADPEEVVVAVTPPRVAEEEAAAEEEVAPSEIPVAGEEEKGKEQREGEEGDGEKDKESGAGS